MFIFIEYNNPNISQFKMKNSKKYIEFHYYTDSLYDSVWDNTYASEKAYETYV